MIAVCLSLIALLGGAVYINSINGQFIWDDQHLIVNNPLIKSWSHLPGIFTGNITAEYPFYRPVLMLTLMFDYALFGLKVQGYHIVTIVTHILAAVTLFFFIKNYLADHVVACVCALLFVAHPIHTENVAYITGRAEPLILILLFSALIQYLKFTDTNKTGAFILCLVCFIAALLIKENSVVLPGLIVLYHVVFRKKINPKILAPVIVIAAVYVYLRLFRFSGTLSDVSGAGTPAMRIPGFFVALANYARLMFLPVALHSATCLEYF